MNNTGFIPTNIHSVSPGRHDARPVTLSNKPSQEVIDSRFRRDESRNQGCSCLPTPFAHSIQYLRR
jgi:hypothetical protein